MADVTINVNAIDTAGWSSPSGAATDIDEAIADADDTTYSAGADSEAQQLVLGLSAHGLSDSDTITNVTITIRYLDGGTAGTLTCDVDFIIGGSSQGTVNTGAVTGSLANYSGLNTGGWNSDWTSSQLDGAQVGLTPQQSGMPGTNLPEIDCVDVVITYTPPAAVDDQEFAATQADLHIGGLVPKALSTYIPYGMRMAPKSIESNLLANAAHFAKTANHLEQTSLGGSVNIVTVSLWFRFDNTSTNEKILSSDNSNYFQIVRFTNTLQCKFRNGTVGVQYNAAMNDTDWHHLGLRFRNGTAVGGANGDAQLYIDGSDVGSEIANDIGTNQFDLNRAFGIGSDSFTGDLDGALAEFWLHTDDVDWSTDLSKFYSSGQPVFLGTDGSTPTGTQPILYLYNPASTFHQNHGSLADLTVNGSLTSVDGPGAYA